MAKLIDVPVSVLEAAGDAVLTLEGGKVLLNSDPQQWAYSARASFEIPGIADAPRGIRIGLEVERGVLGVGWVTADGSDWVTRTSAAAGSGVQDLLLELPPGTTGGSLIFDNWTRGDRPAKASIHRIEVVEIERPMRGAQRVPPATVG